MRRVAVTSGLRALALIGSPVHAQTPLTSADRGKRLYERNCLRCHGAALDGKGPDAASFNPPANFHTYLSRLKGDDELERTIKEGRRFLGMHNWSDTLTDEDVRDLVAYIRHAAPEVEVK